MIKALYKYFILLLLNETTGCEAIPNQTLWLLRTRLYLPRLSVEIRENFKAHHKHQFRPPVTPSDNL